MNSIDEKELAALVELYKGCPEDADAALPLRSQTQDEIWETLSQEPEFQQLQLPRYFAKIELGEALRRRDRPAKQSEPFLLEDTYRLARSHARMLKGESIAMDFVRALNPWGATEPNCIVWHFFEHPFVNAAYLGSAFDFARDTLWESLDNQGLESVDRRDKQTRFNCDLDGVPSLVKKTFQADLGWRYAVSHDVSISGPTYAIQKPDWRQFSEMTNPFALLIQLWRTGCFIFDIPCEEDSDLRLYIRRMDPPTPPPPSSPSSPGTT